MNQPETKARMSVANLKSAPDLRVLTDGIHSILLRYGLALLSVAVAIVLRDDARPIIGCLATLLATVAPAVIFSGWRAGTGPAVVAAIPGLLATSAPAFAIRRYVSTVHEAASFVVCLSALLL